MILSSALMNSRFVVDFDLRKREKFQFSIFDLRCNHLWSYWVEWELVLIVQLCSITCRSIWYIICFDRLLSSVFYDLWNILTMSLYEIIYFYSENLQEILWITFIKTHIQIYLNLLNQSLKSNLFIYLSHNDMQSAMKLICTWCWLRIYCLATVESRDYQKFEWHRDTAWWWSAVRWSCAKFSRSRRLW